jgi:2,3,4,5-tetrahydropyridine-2-carboxylate N-succinyltransferase
MQEIESLIDRAWENRAQVSPSTADPKLRAAVSEVLAQLDKGKLRVAEKLDGAWHTHQWIKKVSLSFVWP